MTERIKRTRKEMIDFLVYHVFDCMSGKEQSKYIQDHLFKEFDQLSDEDLFERHEECMCYD